MWFIEDLYAALAAITIIAVLAGLALWGWRRRSHSQDGLFEELPTTPDDPGELVLGPLDGVYVGSTYAGYWQERIARAPLGFRSVATLEAYTRGLRLELSDTEVWIPRDDLVGVRQESKLAGKVVPGGGLLVARWRVAGRDEYTFIDSGFRANDKDTYPRWAELTGQVDDPGDEIYQRFEETT